MLSNFFSAEIKFFSLLWMDFTLKKYHQFWSINPLDCHFNHTGFYVFFRLSSLFFIYVLCGSTVHLCVCLCVSSMLFVPFNQYRFNGVHFFNKSRNKVKKLEAYKPQFEHLSGHFTGRRIHIHTKLWSVHFKRMIAIILATFE